MPKKFIVVLLFASLCQVACCGKNPRITKQARLEHDLMTGIVTITDITYDEDNKPIINLYIKNPNNYELKVFEVQGGGAVSSPNNNGVDSP